jgi:N-acetylneuraminate lyase
MLQKIAGLVAAPFTPMHADGSLNLSIVPQYARMLAHNGVKGAFVAGSTGEGVSLTYEEKRAVIEAWGTVSEQNLLKIAMVGGNSVAEMQQLARLSAECRYDAVAILAPHYFKINSAETIAQICKEVGEAAPDTAVYFYHIPVLTGVNVSMVQLLEHLDGQMSNFAGIKYTHHDMMEYNQCLNYGGGTYDILWGWDEVFLGGMAMGARGGVGSTFNYAAPLYHRLMAAFDAGDLTEARRLQEKSIEIVKLLGKYGGISVGKAYMRALGMDCGAFRLPVRNMGETQYKSFLQDLEKIEFFAYASELPKVFS